MSKFYRISAGIFALIFCIIFITIIFMGKEYDIRVISGWSALSLMLIWSHLAFANHPKSDDNK